MRFDDGRLAVAEHRFGKGRTLLVGTNPGVAYFRTNGAANKQYFADVFAWTGNTPHVTLSNGALFARLHKGANGGALWISNQTREAQTTRVTLGAGGKLGNAYWGTAANGDTVTVPPRDVAVLAVE